MKRRELLKAALSTLLPACSPPPAAPSDLQPTAAPLPAPLSNVGLQLYTVRDLVAQDPLGTLQKVAELGYKEVEFAGYYALSPSDWKSALDDLGLIAPGAHFHLDLFQSSFDAILQNALTLGHQHLVMPYTPGELRSVEGYKQLAQVLNSTGMTAAQSGVTVGFHNHDFDFEPLPDDPNQIGYDVLLAELDPGLVTLELDIYWIAITDHSAVDYFSRYPGRFRLCHLKDTTPFLAMADVGYGTLDWASILSAAKTAGVAHFFVEHDATTDPIASARRSLAYLTGTA
jgi:sugar phosphate isomerase/epimerase